MTRFSPREAGSAVSAFADAALDRMVAPGYSRLGYALRARRWGDEDPVDQALTGAVVAVTGTNSGIGKAASAQLAGFGAEVVMLVRDVEKGAAARADILRANPGARIRIERCDISDLDDVRSTGRRLGETLPKLDALVHNAGVLPDVRRQSAQGHEITMATHVLGPILLTEELLPALARSARPRVVFVCSGGMYTQSLHVEDLEYRSGTYRGATAYARSKRMQVALLPALAARWAEANVTVAAMHPGWVETPGVAASLPGFHRVAGAVLRSPDQGADTITWLAATAHDLPNARFWHDRKTRPEHYLPRTRNSAAEVDVLRQFVERALQG
ncbi:SDR family NAD(P)-dependent oxidoreductase [Tomitella biformata]|uniref:SDR family NAD(P)-dependent oxidoreductase n=1 Tax=Tomitella biformata TaxID=630403 RepID=UPI000467DCA0|nr:SDR family NAD(P)-dependent oxidoreductase [Tomitella biformata]